MKNVDIMEAVQLGIENILFKQWRHDGLVGGFNGSEVLFKVDGKEYKLKLECKEVQNDRD